MSSSFLNLVFPSAKSADAVKFSSISAKFCLPFFPPPAAPGRGEEGGGQTNLLKVAPTPYVYTTPARPGWIIHKISSSPYQLSVSIL